MQKIKSLLILFSLFVVILLGGCVRGPTPQDPYEKYNRVMFGFDMAVDHLIYRPIAKVYGTITPPPLQRGISNIFSNLGVLTTIPNDILQGKFRWMLIDLWRFIINTTLGVGGLFDMATRLGLPKHYEDFGMTLAYYSDHKKPTYLVLPFLGASTFRAAISQPVDYYIGPWPYINSKALRYSMVGLKWTNVRAELMPMNKLLDTAFDPYAFARSVYLQRRNKLIEENSHDYIPRNKRKHLNLNPHRHPRLGSSRQSRSLRDPR